MAQTIANPNPEPAKVISRASECMRRLMEAGLSYEDLQTPISDPEMRRKLVEFWKSGAPTRTNTGYPVTVNYDQSIEEMVKAGKYTSSNHDINSKNFPVSDRGRVKLRIELVHFDWFMASDDALRELDKQGLRPATLVELLALGEQYPTLQTKFPIVALGSVLDDRDGDRGVAYLLSNGSKRRLNLTWFERRWYDYFRFAAILK